MWKGVRPWTSLGWVSQVGIRRTRIRVRTPRLRTRWSPPAATATERANAAVAGSPAVMPHRHSAWNSRRRRRRFSPPMRWLRSPTACSASVVPPVATTTLPQDESGVFKRSKRTGHGVPRWGRVGDCVAADAESELARPISMGCRHCGSRPGVCPGCSLAERPRAQ